MNSENMNKDEMNQQTAGGPENEAPETVNEADGANAAEQSQETAQESAAAENGSAPENAGEAGDQNGSAKEEKKGFFKKKKDPRDEKIEELTDRVKRQMAEFENFRKRTEKEKSSMYEMGARDIIERILPVVDNFERGLASIPEEAKATPFADGMEKIYKQFQKHWRRPA